MWVSRIQSVDGLSKTKKWVRRNSFSIRLSWSWNISFFLVFDIALNLELVSLDLQVLSPLNLDWNYTIGSLGSSAWQVKILGLLCLHNHMSQSLIINLFMYVLLVLFLWRTLTNIDFGTKSGFGRIESYWWIFWICSRVSGIDSLIWLSLKTLRTLFPANGTLIVHGMF